MQVMLAPRASAILYSLLVSRSDWLPWLMPANICPIVPITFLKAGVPFELGDIDELTLQIDLERVAPRLRDGRFGGLLYAHTYGEPSTPHDFFRWLKASSPATFIVDDRCLCLPSLEAPSESSDLTIFSTGQAKVLDLGGGGFGLLRSPATYSTPPLVYSEQDLQALEQDYKVTVSAGSRYVYKDTNWLDVGSPIRSWPEYREQIKEQLPAVMERKAELNDIYTRRLPADLQLPSSYQSWRFNIRVPDQRRVLGAIFAAGLFASGHYASLAGIMAEGQAPAAAALAGQVVNLFNDHHFTQDMAERVCSVIMEAL